MSKKAIVTPVIKAHRSSPEPLESQTLAEADNLFGLG